MATKEYDYTVDDWIELNNLVGEIIDEDKLFDWELDKLNKARNYIKKQLHIKTGKKLSRSPATGNIYYCNVWTEHDNGMVISYSKRDANAEEIKEFEEAHK